jgi:hypothetical protein
MLKYFYYRRKYKSYEELMKSRHTRPHSGFLLAAASSFLSRNVTPISA